MSSSSKTRAFAALEKQCIVTVNTLISKCKLCVPPVSSILNINCELIVSIFESITNMIIPDLLTTTNKVEEAHNVQAVIDTLSLDILGISLSHITGEDVVSGNLVSISNLLEVLHGIVLYSGSSSSDKSYKRPNLKRIVSQKRKNPSPTLPRTHRQRSSSYKPATEAIQIRKDKLLEHSDSVDGLPNEHQKKTPRRVSTRKKQIGVENGKSIVTQSQIQSSTKSPPTKIKKQQTDRKQILLPKQSKPALDDKTSCRKTSRSSLRLQLKSVKAKAEQPIKTTKSEIIRKVSSKENRSTLNSRAKTVNSFVKEIVSKPTTTCEIVEDLHEKNLERKIKVIIDRNSYLTSRASHMKKWHFPNARKPVQSSIPSCKKSFLLPYTLRPKPVGKRIMRRKTDGVILFQNNQSNTGIKEARKAMPGIIKDINEDFPGLELPPSVVNLITKKYQQHLINMHKKARNCLLKVPKTEVQIEEAAEKQSAISNLLRKDIKHQQHMKQLKENKENSNKLKYHLRNSRMQSVKMKQYCKEFQLEMRKKMMKRNYAEELIYEKVFEDALQIQKEQVDRLCKEYKESGETDARKQLIYLDALENLYQSQFNMMSEALASQKHDTQDQVKAEKQAMDLMHREFQDELKKEIRFMQQAIIECTEDTHFRELDAEECTEKLRNIMS